MRYCLTIFLILFATMVFMPSIHADKALSPHKHSAQSYQKTRPAKLTPTQKIRARQLLSQLTPAQKEKLRYPKSRRQFLNTYPKNDRRIIKRYLLHLKRKHDQSIKAAKLKKAKS